jgi:hypothetical protein
VLVGFEDLSSGREGVGLVHPELTVGGTILVFSLKGILGDHGSHEDVVVIGGESGSGDSLVAAISKLVVLGGLEELSGMVNFIVLNGELNLLALLVIGGAGGAAGLAAGRVARRALGKLSVGSQGWSGIGRFNGVITIELLETSIGSVVLDRSKTPDWLTSSASIREGWGVVVAEVNIGGSVAGKNGNDCEFHYFL